MLIVDSFEPLEIEMMLRQLLGSDNVDRQPSNQNGFPDYTITTAAGTTLGISRKQGGELVGGIDAAEAQLARDAMQVDHLYLLIEGLIELYGAGCAAYRYGKWKEYHGDGVHSFGHRIADRRYFAQNYKGVQAWLSRIQETGIRLVQTADYESTAQALAALHGNAQKPEHDTFKRLIKERIVVNALDPAERLFKQQVMGLGANCGEEIADALWSGGYRSMFDLIAGMETEGQVANIAALGLRSGRRTVGPAAVSRLRKALGL